MRNPSLFPFLFFVSASFSLMGCEPLHRDIDPLWPLDTETDAGDTANHNAHSNSDHDACTSHSDDTLCSVHLFECGFLELQDSCGVRRRISCGDCNEEEHCAGGICHSQPPTCSDSSQQTDTDCGGPYCPPCQSGQRCAQPSDCASGFCNEQRCDNTFAWSHPANGDTLPNGETITLAVDANDPTGIKVDHIRFFSDHDFISVADDPNAGDDYDGLWTVEWEISGFDSQQSLPLRALIAHQDDTIHEMAILITIE